MSKIGRCDVESRSEIVKSYEDLFAGKSWVILSQAARRRVI